MKARVLILVASILVGRSISLAQIATARPTTGPVTPYVEGFVLTESGAPIRSARIVLTGISGGTGQTTFSDGDGRFAAYLLETRRYNMTVSAAGFIEVTLGIDLETAPSPNTRIVMRVAKGPTQSAAGASSANDLAAPPKASQYYQDGLKELNQKKFASSVELLKKAINEHPTYAAAYSTMGIAYVQLRKTDLAREAFTKALELNQNSSEATLGFGLLLNDEKRYAEAEKYLLRAQEMTPADWHVQYELGRAYYGLNALEKAEDHLKRARKENPAYGNLYLTLANVLVLQTKLEEGLAEMEEFLRVAPDNALAPQVRDKVRLLKEEIKKP